jgi:WD40 repeat protein
MSVDLLSREMSSLNINFCSLESEKKVLNVHKDDVHALLKMKECFYSGSKDGTLASWNFEGVKIKDVTKSYTGDYRKWVTALSSCGESDYVAGYRDGVIEFYNDKDQLIKSISNITQGLSLGRVGFSKANGYVCKDRNQERITCLSDATEFQGRKKFFVGTPASFKLVDYETGRLEISQKIHANDWIYCINPLPQKRLAVVVGASLDIWSFHRNEECWKLQSNIVVETPNLKGHQRAFISSLQPLFESRQMAYTDFQGGVKVVDLETSCELRSFSEHRGRVWHVVALSPQVLASGADDKIVKIWDIRSSQSVLNFKRHPGRVSQLLTKTPLSFIAASCPDDVVSSFDKAEFTLRDLRRNNA